MKYKDKKKEKCMNKRTKREKENNNCKNTSDKLSFATF